MTPAMPNAAPAPRRSPSPTAPPAPTAPPPVAAAAPPTQPVYTLTAPLDAPGGIGLRTEWLLTDGRGGFAMGTAAGVPTRRYHALYIAAARPPVGRTAMLNATVDRLIVHPDQPHALTIDLSSFRFTGAGEQLHPDGASRLTKFEKSGEVSWMYEFGPARITRRLMLTRGDAATPSVALLRYQVERMPAAGSHPGPLPPLRLTVRPLVSLRDFHALIRRQTDDRFQVRALDHGWNIERDGIELNLGAAQADGVGHQSDSQWWFNFLYAEDAARGQDCIEDLFSPGEFTLDLAPTQQRAELLIRVSPHDQPSPRLSDWDTAQADRQRRVTSLINAARASTPAADPVIRPWLDALALAADDFVVARRSEHIDRSHSDAEVSIIAGYPWFSDWGRDTFISLPGLMLAAGRHDEARATLLAFAAHRQRGLIPNVFDDRTGEAEYNTVDGSLWFIQAACEYAQRTGDRRTWREHLAPACLDIISHYRRGADFNIAMDPFDKLITAGTSATQLTWMDARRDGVVFTPRHGKAVEINALWISGLRRVAELIAVDDSAQAANLNDLAEAAAKSFRSKFWNPAAACLFDVLSPSDSERGEATWTPDAAIRPNQIFAVSLPHSPLSIEQQRAVVACVRSNLLTPRGVRTLHPADSRYRGRYQGSLFDRDGAYHQGTAWPWLLGPLAEATLRIGGFTDAARREAIEILRPMLQTLEPASFAGTAEGGCRGHIAEIFDGDAPQRPQGCPAQAWSVAELNRVLVLIGSNQPK